MSDSYDAIVIGAGHNGLVAANYLARGGKRVLVLESRDVLGGACTTEELIPGAKWSSCAFIAGLLPLVYATGAGAIGMTVAPVSGQADEATSGSTSCGSPASPARRSR